MKISKNRIFAVFVAAAACACMALPFSACSGSDEGKKDANPEKYFLTAVGEEVRNGYDETVLLRGVNAGGLFVTEHWMTGFVYGSSPSNDYRSLTQTFIERFGEEKTKALWQTYRENWWSDVDFKNCAEIGINVIRLPFTYMNVDFAAVTDYEKAGINYDFSALDDFINKAWEYDIYTILDLHGAYGSQNGQDHSGEIISSASNVKFYSDAQMMGLTSKLWGALAEHYKNNPAVAGYDILNEPGEKAGSTSERHWEFYNQAYKAIRATGDNHIVIFESCWDGENLPPVTKYGWKNCMYSFHHYADSNLSDEAHCLDWNNKIANVTSQNFGVPLQMGEFTSYASEAKWEYTLDLLNRSGWSWTSWTYKVWGNMPWGIINIRGTNADKVNASEDSYETILEKFKILRSDGESARRYSFGSKTLENIISEYSTAEQPESIEEGVYTFNSDNGWLSQTAYGQGKVRFILTEDANAAMRLNLVYNKLNDGSAYLTADGKYLSVAGSGNETYLTLTSSADNASRFYPVMYEDGAVLISYSLCKYLTADNSSVLRADGTAFSDAVIFTLVGV